MPGCDSAARDGQTVTWKAKSQLFGSLPSRKPGTTRDSLLTEEGDWQAGKDGSLLTEEGDRPAGKDGTPIACPGKGVPAFPPGRPAAAPAAAVARRTLRIPRPIHHINQGVNGRTARAPPGYHTAEQVSNPEPLDSRPCVLTTTLLGGGGGGTREREREQRTP